MRILPLKILIGTKSFKNHHDNLPRMLWFPQVCFCAFVMVIKGYDSITPLVLRFDAAGGVHISFRPPPIIPPPPLSSHSLRHAV